MSLVHRVLTVLVNSETPLRPMSIMAKSGVDRDDLGNTLTRLLKDGRISKLARGLYSMTDEQRAKVAYLSAQAAPKESFGVGITAADLSRRLRRLTEISQRPAFLGDAILNDIIKDYRQALDRATGQEDNDNEEA